ncbi:hypothetical protein D3C71_1968870 [compost metagenome]
MGGVEQVATLVRALLDVGGGHDGGQRQPGAQRFGQREDVGQHTVAFERKHGACAAHAGLRLVQDQQHLALFALLLERGQIA